jgi:hypothetical protein
MGAHCADIIALKYANYEKFSFIVSPSILIPAVKVGIAQARIIELAGKPCHN